MTKSTITPTQDEVIARQIVKDYAPELYRVIAKEPEGIIVAEQLEGRIADALAQKQTALVEVVKAKRDEWQRREYLEWFNAKTQAANEILKAIQ
jgi:hypothetical protein